MYVCTVQDAFLSQLSIVWLPTWCRRQLIPLCSAHAPCTGLTIYNKLNTYYCVTGAALILHAKSLIISTLCIIMHNN